MALLPIIIIAIFLGMWWMRRGSTLTRNCRWREDRATGPGHFRCAACGAEIDLAPGKRPRDCLKDRAA